MKKIFLTILSGIILTEASLAQTASSVWELTTNTTPIIIGEVVSANQSAMNLSYIEWKTTYQRRAISSTNKLLPVGYNESYYIQYIIAPKPGYSINVNSITMKLFCDGTSDKGKAAIYYSLKNDFSSSTAIYSFATPLSLSGSLPANPNVSFTGNIRVSNGDTLYLRVYPWLTEVTSSGKYLASANVVISGIAQSTIAIITSTDELSEFMQTTATPSDSKSYSVSGLNLTNNVIITPPENFEISTDAGSSWNNNLSPVALTQTGGVISGQPVTILVRMNLSSAGAFSSEITHNSEGASIKRVLVSGVRLMAEPTVQSAITFGNTTGSTIEVNFSGGNGSRRILVARKLNPVSWAPSDGSGVNANSDFSSAIDMGDSNKVIYDGAGNSVIVSGLNVGTLYHFAVYEYNVASGNSQNYLIDSPGRGNISSLSISTLYVTPDSLNFGLAVVSGSIIEKSFMLEGNFLSPESGNITVSAPVGYQVSVVSKANYASTLEIPYTDSSIRKTIYVCFIPTENTIYSGIISIAGGGAVEVNVAVNGKGVSSSTLPSMQMIGYATVSGEGYTTTTGGAGGTVTTVRTLADLQTWAAARENKTNPAILYIDGKISSPTSTVVTIKHGANISIYGVGSTAELQNVGLNIRNYKNVIIRNLIIHEVLYPNDALTIDECRHVWVDHCELYSKIGPGIGVDTYDGLLDIKNGSRYVTVSWCYFHHHMKCMLWGHTDNVAQRQIDSLMRISFHHNWVSYTDGRNPSLRFGVAHIFNNYFEEITDYGVAARVGARVKLENNHYRNVVLPMSTDKFPVTGLPNGYICESGNLFSGLCGEKVISQAGCEWWNFETLPYLYELDPVEMIEENVKLYAGVGIITTTVKKHMEELPIAFKLYQNYPNPFNPTTTIRFDIPNVGTHHDVSLKIYDIIGREVATLVNEPKEVGSYEVVLDASNLASGIYFYKLQASNFSSVKKLVLMK